MGARDDIEAANKYPITDPRHPFPVGRYRAMVENEMQLFRDSGREPGGEDVELMNWLHSNGYGDQARDASGQVVRVRELQPVESKRRLR